MSAFYWSQCLIAIAILFDLASFQFKDRRKIVACLAVAGALIASHFFLLEQYTAAGLMAVAVTRYFLSIFTTSKRVMFVFIIIAMVVTSLTYSGVISLISFTGATLQTIAAFCQQDKKLRQFMIIGTSVWLVHNALVGSPTAVLMEALFISSNLIGYYRFYISPNTNKLNY